MSEKFREIVNAPHRAFGKLKKRIQNTTPQKTASKVARGAGIGTTATMQAVLWFVEHFSLDNFITRGGEKAFSQIKVGKNKQGQDKKFPKFIKQNPNFTAIVTWWMMLATLTGVGIKNKDKIADAIKDKIENIKGRFSRSDDEEATEEYEEEFEKGTYGAYFDRLRTITPFVIANLIANEGVRVNSQGMHVVYDDYDGHKLKPGEKPKGTATIGFGSTMLKDGTRVTSDTKPITNEEAYELARWHLEEGETYFGMYCYDTAFESVDINSVPEALAIADVMYNGFSKFIEPDTVNGKANYTLGNRFATLRDSLETKGAGLSDEDVLKAFKKYPATNKNSFGEAWLNGKPKKEVANSLGNFLRGGRGIWMRRWVEAGLLTGELSPDLLLDCPVDGLSAFLKYKQKDVKNKKTDKTAFWKEDANGIRFVNKDTYAEFIEWLANPVNEHGQSIAKWKKVRDYMPEYALEACDGKECQLGDKASKKHRVQQKKFERETYVLDYETAYALAIKAYNASDYDSAAKQFEQLVMDNPDNALLYNDLAATYNHLGRYNDAIKQAQEIVQRIGDKSQYAAAQYNAGFAYEQLGKLDNALANYKLAVANGNSRVKSDVTRVKNKINQRTINKDKAISFNEAAGRVKNKMAKINIVNRNKNGENRA